MRILARLGAFGLLAAAVAPALAAQTVTFGLARDGSAFQYEYVRMPFWADMTASGGALLGSYTVRITFNPNVLSYSEVEPGTFADPVIRADSAYLGVLWLAAASPTGAGGFVNLGHIVFYVPGTGEGGETVSVVGIQVTEASAAGTFTSLLPMVTTSGGIYCHALGRWGDVDNSGDANSFDALLILSAVVGLPVDTTLFKLRLGDSDGDGRTDTRDALILLSYAVGIDISGQRVLTVVPGACALQGATQVTIAPDTIDVVSGQRTLLRVSSRDAGGVPTFLNGLNWIVDDPRVGVVDGTTNEFIARDSGTTRLRAYLGPGIQVSVPVTVRNRRTVWRVDGTRGRGAIALGNARYPFWSPQQVFPLLQEGDTIRVAPGIHDYDDELSDDAAVGFVLIGDTLADGTRPVLRAPGVCCNMANLSYYYDGPPPGGAQGSAAAGAPRRVVMQDLVLQHFNRVLYADGLSTLIMRNVRVEAALGSYSDGIDIYNLPDTVDVQDVAFIADSAYGAGDALYLPYGAGLVRLSNVTIHYFDDGLYLGDGADSVHVDGSEFLGLNEALSLYGYQRPFGGVYVANNRFTDNYRGLAGFEIPRATLMSNVWDNHQDETIQLYAPSYVVPEPGSVRYTIIGDSVRSPGYASDWLQASDFDTLLVQDVHVLMDTTYVYMYVYGDHATFRRTVLDGVHYEAFDLNVHTAILDTVSAIGCPTCAYNIVSGVSVRSRSGENGVAVTIRGGTFRRLYYGAYLYSLNLPGPVTIRDAVFDSVTYGMLAYVDSAVIENTRATAVSTTGIGLYPSGDRPNSFAYVLRQNAIACNPTGANYGIYLERTRTTFERNYVQNCDYGIYTYNYLASILDVSFAGDSVFLTGYPTATRGIYLLSRWRPTLTGVRVRGGTYGIDISTNDTATVRIDSSAVSQTTTAGIYLAPEVGTVVTGVRNNITNNLLDGIYNSGTGTRSFTLGRFVGNGRWAINSSSAFDAQQNWWGNAAGPGPGIAADSSSTLLVGDSPFLTVDPTDVPPPAPPAMARAVPIGAPAAGVRPEQPAVQVRPADAPPMPVAGDAARAAARQRSLEKRLSRASPPSH